MAKDMTKGNPGKTLFFFAVPMVLGNLFQQLYNIIDSIIVGNYVGADALAAVGASSSITFLFVAIATGLSIGSSVVISQYFGAKRYGEMKTAIQTVLLASFVIALCLMLVGIFGTDAILRFMQTPQKIFSDASLYLKIYFCGLIFLFLYNMLTASFNAIFHLQHCPGSVFCDKAEDGRSRSSTGNRHFAGDFRGRFVSVASHSYAENENRRKKQAF